MKSRLQSFIILAIMIGAGLSLVGLARAESYDQAKASLTVVPAILELNLQPGEIKKAKIAIINSADQPVPVKSVIAKLELQQDNQLSTKDIFDASAWFKIIQGDYILQPGQQRDVELEISVPKLAEPGGHYATIYFEPLLPAQQQAADTAKTTARVGVLAFLTIQGKQTIAAGLTQNLTTHKFQQFGPVDFAFDIKNSGTSHILPGGSIRIFDNGKNMIQEIIIPPGVVLPNTSRRYELRWDKKILFGHYRAKLQISYSAQNKVLSSQADFWVIPGVYIAFGLIAVISIIIFVIKTHRRWSRAWKVLLNQ